MRKKIEIIFDKHDGKLVRLEDYNKLKKELEDLKLINKINIAMDKGEQIKDIIKSLKEQNK